MLIARQQKLVRILIQDKCWHTLSELSYQLGCANKTIRRDVIYLREYLPSNWRIEAVKGKGIRLCKPLEDGIEEFEARFEQHDMTFQILDQLFFQSFSTMKDLASNLYIQVPSLYKHIEKVQTYLSHFDLKLVKYPLRIQGTESHIIFLFAELYLKIYQQNTWPFASFSQEEILNFIKHIEKKLKLILYPSDRYKISYFLAVLLHRKSQGYTVFVTNGYMKIIKETEFYQKISSVKNNLCGKELHVVDKIVITILINCSKYLHEDIEQFKQNMLLDLHDGKLMVYRYVKSFITMLENTCNLNLIQDDEFVFNIIQHLKQTIYKYSLIPNIEPPLENKMSLIKQKHFQTFEQVKKVYWNWIREYNIASFVWEEDIVIVTLQIEAVKLVSKLPSKKALLYTEDNFTWGRYIKGVLFHTFGTDLKIELISDICMETFDFSQCHVDIIITTYPLSNMPIQTICISKIPTRRDLENIENLLYKV